MARSLVASRPDGCGDADLADAAVGEQRRFSPVAGVTIELNTDSRIGWLQSGARCELWLEQGEAAGLAGRVQGAGSCLGYAQVSMYNSSILKRAR